MSFIGCTFGTSGGQGVGANPNGGTNSGYGGVLSLLAGSNATVSNGIFRNNWAVRGSAAFVDGSSSLDISTSTFTNAQLQNGGNGVSMVGGLFFVSNSGRLTLNGLTISDQNNQNLNAQEGGFIYATLGGQVNLTGVSSYRCSVNNRGGVIYSDLGSSIVVETGVTMNLCQASAGGAIYSSASALSVTGATFTSNQANNGASISIVGSSAQIATSTFTLGVAQNGGGGAISVTNIASPATIASVSISQCTFGGSSSSGNIARNGGAVYINGGSVQVDDSTFAFNSASNTGGGAIFASGNTFASVVAISKSIFNRNSASTSGGAIIMTNGAVLSSVSGSTFTNNNAPSGSGGAIAITNKAAFAVSSSVFTSNAATSSGGAISCDDTTAFSCSDSIFSYNTANSNGGAMSLSSNSYLTGMSNCSFSNNNADGNGGAAHVATGSSLVNIASASFTSNIAGNNGGAMWLSAPNLLTSYTLSQLAFTANAAAGRGGALFLTGAPLGYYLDNVAMSQNSARVGGAMSFEPTNAVVAVMIDRSSFTENMATTWGGAASIYSTNSFRINGTSLTSNVAGYGGGALFAPNWATSGVRPGVVVTHTYFGSNVASGKLTGTSSGGAIFSMVDLDMRTSTFFNNTADPSGGAVASLGGLCTCFESNFYNNSVYSGSGGAIFADMTSVPAILGCVFESNMASVSGGAVFSQAAHTELRSSVFKYNSAMINGGALSCSTSALNMLDGEFSSNYAGNGGAVFVSGPSNINGVLFNKNMATEGGALYCSPADFSTALTTASISGATFAHNEASANGGAISGPCPLEVLSSTFSGNSAQTNGGAISATPSVSNGDSIFSKSTFSNNFAIQGHGGAIFSQSSSSSVSVTVQECAIDFNLAQSGAGVFVAGWTNLDGSKITDNGIDDDVAVDVGGILTSSGSVSNIGTLNVYDGVVSTDSEVVAFRVNLFGGSVEIGGSQLTAASLLNAEAGAVMGLVACAAGCNATVPMQSNLTISGSGALVNYGKLQVGPSDATPMDPAVPCVTVANGGSIINRGLFIVNPSCVITSGNGNSVGFVQNYGNWSLNVDRTTSLVGVGVKLMAGSDSVLDVPAKSNTTFGHLSVDKAPVVVGGTLNWWAIAPFISNASSYEIITIINSNQNNSVSGAFDKSNFTTNDARLAPVVAYTLSAVTITVGEPAAIVNPPPYGAIFGAIFGILGAACLIAVIVILVIKKKRNEKQENASEMKP